MVYRFVALFQGFFPMTAKVMVCSLQIVLGFQQGTDGMMDCRVPLVSFVLRFRSAGGRR